MVYSPGRDAKVRIDSFALKGDRSMPSPSGIWAIYANGFDTQLSFEPSRPPRVSGLFGGVDRLSGTWNESLSEINFTVTREKGTPAQEVQHYKGFLFDNNVNLPFAPPAGTTSVIAGTFTSARRIRKS
jgi:hypothetical protein